MLYDSGLLPRILECDEMKPELRCYSLSKYLLQKGHKGIHCTMIYAVII